MSVPKCGPPAAARQIQPPSPRPDLFVGSPRRVLTVLGLTLVLITSIAYQAFAASPANGAFQRTWERPDQPVRSGQVSRTWMWGPEGFTGQMSEEYDGSPGGQRLVQYFDKARMEDNSYRADAPWDVTNGLLVIELMTGAMQTGDTSFVELDPAAINVAGDADDPNGITYAMLAGLRDAAPQADGAAILQRIDANGGVVNDASLQSYGVMAAHRVAEPGIDHQVASPFWAFMNAQDIIYEDGELTTSQLFPSAFYATGLPVTEAYWAEVKVAGTYKDVLIQAFERRVLTYTPDNPAGWQVEAGNVGQHYYAWRYGDGGSEQPIPDPSPTSDPSPTPEPDPTPEPQPDPELDYVYRGTIGAGSSKLNDFDKLSGIVMSPDGTLVVVDQVTERVQGYSTTGDWKFGFGGEGEDKGPTGAPQDVEVDAQGRIWVLDWENGRVAQLDENGEVVDSIGDKVSEPAILKNPAGFTIGPDGRFYVSDSGNHRVVVFDPDGTTRFAIGAKGDGDGRFTYPNGIAVHESGNIFVADQNSHEIEMFNSSGQHLLTWGTEGAGEEQFKYPSELEIDEIGNLYVADFGNNRVAVYSTDGEFARIIGEEGDAPGQMKSPIDIAVDNDGHIYVAGRDDQYIHKFNDGGEFVDRWNGDARSNFVRASSVDLTDDGLLFITDQGLRTGEGSAVRVFNVEGDLVQTYTDEFSKPQDIVVAGEYVYLTDGLKDRVWKYTRDFEYVTHWGGTGSEEGQFNDPYGIDVDADGYVYVADSENIRVQKFTADGEFVTAWGELGNDPGEFQEPLGLAIQGDRVYVTDWVGDRVQAFDLDGNFILGWGQAGNENGSFNEAWHIDVDRDGYVYVTDRSNHRVQKFTGDGEFLTVLDPTTVPEMPVSSSPTGIVVQEQDMVYIVSDLLDAVMVFVPPSYGGNI